MNNDCIATKQYLEICCSLQPLIYTSRRKTHPYSPTPKSEEIFLEILYFHSTMPIDNQALKVDFALESIIIMELTENFVFLSGKNSLAFLIDQVVVQVFSFLDEVSISQAMLCCKAFNTNAFHADIPAWHQIDLNSWRYDLKYYKELNAMKECQELDPEDTSDDYLDILLSFSLSNDLGHIDNKFDVVKATNRIIAENRFKNLQCLHLFGGKCAHITEGTFSILLNSCQLSLKELSFCDFNVSKIFLDGITNKLKILQQILRIEALFSDTTNSVMCLLQLDVKPTPTLVDVLDIPELITIWMTDLNTDMRIWVDKTIAWWCKNPDPRATELGISPHSPWQPHLTEEGSGGSSSGDGGGGGLFCTYIPEETSQVLANYLSETKKTAELSDVTTIITTNTTSKSTNSNNNSNNNKLLQQMWLIIEIKAQSSFIASIKYLHKRYFTAVDGRDWAFYTPRGTDVEAHETNDCYRTTNSDIFDTVYTLEDRINTNNNNTSTSNNSNKSNKDSSSTEYDKNQIYIMKLYTSLIKDADNCKTDFLAVSLLAVEHISNYIFKSLPHEYITDSFKLWIDSTSSSTSTSTNTGDNNESGPIQAASSTSTYAHTESNAENSNANTFNETHIKHVVEDVEIIKSNFKEMIGTSTYGLLTSRLHYLSQCVTLLTAQLKSESYLNCIQDLLQQCSKEHVEADSFAVLVETMLKLRIDKGLLYNSFTTEPIRAMRALQRTSITTTTTTTTAASISSRNIITKALRRDIFTCISLQDMLLHSTTIIQQIEENKEILRRDSLHDYIKETIKDGGGIGGGSIRGDSIRGMSDVGDDVEVLLVEVVQIRNLPVMTIFGKEKKYFKLYIDEVEVTVSSTNSNKEPSWPDGLSNIIRNSTGKSLLLEIYYKRRLVRDLLIGYVKLPLSGLDGNSTRFDMNLKLDRCDNSVKRVVEELGQEPRVILNLSVHDL
eukprot:gene4185-8321_t